MKDNEKFCLMIAIMEDLRGDWSNNLKNRVKKVRELAKELGHTKTIELCDDFEYDDGRHFSKK